MVFEFCCFKRTIDPIEEDPSALFSSTKYPSNLRIGGLAEYELDGFFQSRLLMSKYLIIDGIAGGPHWAAAFGKRKRDGKCVIIKKIIKAKLPVAEQYFQPCVGLKTCNCTKCRPDIVNRPPLELVLFYSRYTSLPLFLECIEDEDNYYLISHTHGVPEIRLKYPRTWFGSSKWSVVNWREYFS